MFSYCNVLVVRYNFGTLTACHLLFLRCLMHVKLNVIKLFNRLSLSANQNTTKELSSVITTAMLVSSPVKVNNIRNSLIDAKTDDLDSECKTSIPVASTKNNNNQKFIISSNYQLHEDDLSRIDVKSLVRTKKVFASYIINSMFTLRALRAYIFCFNSISLFCLLLINRISIIN